ncbi:MAG: hypothetical protein AB7O59_23445 [Pirellulales bacterium]
MRRFHGRNRGHRRSPANRWVWLALGLLCLPSAAWAQGFVPGTGQKLTKVGDDFEDPQWTYVYNTPKSSEENDGAHRLPGGSSKNGRWFEGAMRGQPDLVKRVDTPEGGPEGSTGALLLGSKQTGVPGHYSGKFQQDDFICNVSARLGGGIPIWRSPSVVVRVCLPPWEEWERRNGPSFGVRTACQTHKTETKPGRGFFGSASRTTKPETYWPGFFIHFVPGDGKERQDSALITVRAGAYGQDLRGPKITETGWWTFGMSFTPDGRVHYYAHPGVEDLTAADHFTTQYPYSYHCERMDTLFFNVVSGDNGNWSTPWIIDDAEVFVAR